MAFDLHEKFIVAAEKTLNCKLPSSYRWSMQENNGGTIEADDGFWDLFTIADNSDKKRLSRSCNNIITEMKRSSLRANFPKNVLAIASDGTGDLMILKKDPSGDCYFDNVYIWFHETGEIVELVSDFKELEVG